MTKHLNKYWTRDGKYLPAWKLSDEQLEMAIAYAVHDMQVHGMNYDVDRVNELQCEWDIRQSPENVVRFMSA